MKGLNDYSKNSKPAYPPSLIKRTALRLGRILKNVTIEPAVFLISFSSSMDDVTLSQMTLYKSCTNDFLEYNQTVCTNLIQYGDANRVVQQEVCSS